MNIRRIIDISYSSIITNIILLAFSGLNITFAENARFFQTAKADVNPRIIIKGSLLATSANISYDLETRGPLPFSLSFFLFSIDIRLVPQLILLKEPLLQSINRRLLSANIQVPFFATIAKTFSIELGI